MQQTTNDAAPARLPDAHYLHLALEQARLAAVQGEVPVGAVVVDAHGAVIGQGHNRCVHQHDPAGHAEIMALRAAAQTAQNYRLDGCTLYVTLEPCAMCAGACVNAKLGRLVFGALDEVAGCCGSRIDLTDKCFLHSVETWGGILEEDCKTLLSSFFQALR